MSKNIIWIKPPMQAPVGFRTYMDAIRHIGSLVGEVTDAKLEGTDLRINDMRFEAYEGDNNGNKVGKQIPTQFCKILLGSVNQHKKIGGVKAKDLCEQIKANFFSKILRNKYDRSDFDAVIELLVSVYTKYVGMSKEKQRKVLNELQQFLSKIRTYN